MSEFPSVRPGRPQGTQDRAAEPLTGAFVRRWSARLTFSIFCVTALASACTCGAEPVVERTVFLRLIPAVVNFGTLPVGARRERTVVVRNDGNSPWTPAGPPVVVGRGFSFGSGCLAPVDPGGTCSAVLRFQPEFEGEAEGAVSVESPARAGGVVVVGAVLSASAGPATLLLSPPQLDFGVVAVGGSAFLNLTLENRGDEALDVPLVLSGGPFLFEGFSEILEHLEPNSSIDVAVAFAPTQGIGFSGLVTAEICGVGCGPFVVLQGTGSAPRIDVQPRRLTIGAVAAGNTGTGTLRITNIGQGALVIEGVDVEDQSGAFVLTLPVLPAILDSNEGIDVVLAFSPLTGRGADVEAAVIVRSTDPVSGSVVVTVVASSPGAGIAVAPRVGQFGYLNDDAQRSLSVVVRSIGDAPLEIQAIRLEGDAGFTLRGAPTPGPLAAGDAAQFFVVAQSSLSAAAAGGAEATLVVSSDAGVQRIPLAFVSGNSGCVPTAVIAQTNIGAVQVGLSKSGEVVVENRGDAACFLNLIAAGSELGLPSDAAFEVVERGLAELAPQAQGLVAFGFAPERIGPRSSIAALFFQGRESPLLVSASGNGVRGGLVGAPAVVTLGPVAGGCSVPTSTVVFFNDGASFVVVDSVVLEPEGGPFSLSGPEVPLRLSPGQSTAFSVDAVSRDGNIGRNVASIVADTVEGLSARIEVRLTVTPPAEPVVEVFDVPERVAVDILFVIDNSGSMQDDQELLAANFGDFIAAALVDFDLDVQIGVTTTDVISLDSAAGTLIGSPPILSKDDANALAARVLVGIEGTGLELGLEAMRLALEVPENAGFIRSSAALAIIFVTDEDDAGALVEFLPDPALSRTPAEYTALLEAKKAGSVSNAPVLVSAVLPAGGGDRYRAVVDHFGGISLDITSPDWGTRLSEIGNATFALSRSFQLGSPPRSGTVAVTVDGVVAAFTVNAARAVIVVDGVVPGGSAVVITYLPEC